MSRRLGLGLMLLSALLAFSAQPAAARRVALVIGNGGYENVKVLSNPTNDARDVAEALSRHGFDEVRVFRDLNRNDMVRELRAFASIAEGAEIALVYYAGHGLAVGDRNWLVPVDANMRDEVDVSESAINLETVLERISGASKLGMVVLDACRDNPFAKRIASRSTSRSTQSRGLVRVEPSRPSTLIAYAAAPREVTPDGAPGGNSPFTAAFIKAMDGPATDVRLMLGALRDHLRATEPEAEPGVYSTLGGQSIVVNQGTVQVAGLSSVAGGASLAAPSGGAARTWTVSAIGSADHRTLEAAIAAAAPGDRIELAPGVHTGGVTVDKPLEIFGRGGKERVTLQVEGDVDAITWTANGGRIAGLTIRHLGKADKNTFGAVFFSNGSAVLEDSDLTSQAGSAVYIVGASAAPTVRRNMIHDAQAEGVNIDDNGKGRIEVNQIFGNGEAGVVIRNGADPVVTGNTIRDGKKSGAIVYKDGKGRIEGNQIINNPVAGVTIATGGDPVVTGNIIRDGKQVGVIVFENGKGRIEGNQIINNAVAGVAIATGGDPVVTGNIIRDGKQVGVFVSENGKGRIEGNQIINNAEAGVAITTGGDPIVTGNTVTRNGYEAIWIYEQGRGTFADNDLRGNSRAAWDIESSAGPVIRSNNRE